jgi:hypothetical protein
VQAVGCAAAWKVQVEAAGVAQVEAAAGKAQVEGRRGEGADGGAGVCGGGEGFFSRSEALVAEGLGDGRAYAVAVNIRSPGRKFDRKKFSTSFFLGVERLGTLKGGKVKIIQRKNIILNINLNKQT